MTATGERNAIDLLQRASASQFVFLCGAGISQNPPTQVPTVQSFIDFLLEGCSASAAIRALVRDRLNSSLITPRFEVLVDDIARLHDRNLEVAKVFKAGGFNNIHTYLGQMLLRGSSIITTNFDNCIENSLAAGGEGYSRQVFDGHDLEQPSTLGGCLVKIHGSVPRDAKDTSRLLITIRSLAETSGGFQRFPRWRDYLVALIEKRLLTVFGYSGSDDFDVIPVLLSSRPAHVLWIVFDPDATAPATISQADVSERLRAFGDALPTTFIKSRLDHLVQHLQDAHHLVESESVGDIKALSVVDYVSTVYSTPLLRKELLNVVLLHFSLFEVVASDAFVQESSILTVQHATALYRLGRYEEAIHAFEAVDTKIAEPGVRIQALYFYSASLYYFGRVELAIRTAEALLLVCRELEDAVAEVTVLIHLGGMYFSQRQDDRASQSYSEVLGLQGQKPVSIESEAKAWWGLGDVQLRKGNSQAARSLYERARRINLDLGNEANVAWLEHNLGEADIQEHKYESAISVLQQAEMRFRDLKNPSGLIYVLNAQAKALYQTADLVTLRQKIAELAAILAKHPGAPTGPEALIIVALYVIGQPDDHEIRAEATVLFNSVLAGRAETPTVAVMKETVAEDFPGRLAQKFEQYLFTSAGTL